MTARVLTLPAAPAHLSARKRRSWQRQMEHLFARVPGVVIENPEPPAHATRDQRCGAPTQKGGPCENRNVYPNGRCKVHGGPGGAPAAVLWAAENL